MLKQIIGLITITLILGISIFSQQVIQNPDKPTAKNAGRIAKLTEVLRIQDDGKNFYFKRPGNIKIAPDGTIFIIDDAQLLKFTPQGKFIKNLQKKGEGPGEYTYLTGYTIIDNKLKIITNQPSKVLDFSLDGKLIKETRTTNKDGFMRVVGIFPTKFYYLRGEISFTKTKSGTQDFIMDLYNSTYDDKYSKVGLQLSERWVAEKQSNKDGAMMIRMRSLDNTCIEVENEHSFYVSHTPNYLVKQYDLATGKLIRQFTRKYKSVSYVPEEPVSGQNQIPGYKKDYFSDVIAIAMYKGKLWVFTSTLDKQKGQLVDVFTPDGKYVDNFYLPLPNLQRPDSISDFKYTLNGDYIFYATEDEEENPIVIKYKIEI